MKKNTIGALVILLILGLTGWAQAAATSVDYTFDWTFTLSWSDGKLALCWDDLTFTDSETALDPALSYNYSVNLESSLLGDTQSKTVELGTYQGIAGLNTLLDQYSSIFTKYTSGKSFSVTVVQVANLLTLLGMDTPGSAANLLSIHTSYLGPSH